MSYYDTAEQLRVAVSALLPPEEYVCLLTSQAQILQAEQAWREFARENSHDVGPYAAGWNLVQMCGHHDDEPQPQNLGEAKEVDLEFPLAQSPEPRWLRLTITPWMDRGRRALTVVTTVDRQPSSLPDRLLQASLCYH